MSAGDQRLHGRQHRWNGTLQSRLAGGAAWWLGGELAGWQNFLGRVNGLFSC
jgi:hypothetical protein